MNFIDTVSQMFGIHRMPWVIRVYLLLFFAALGVMGYAAVNMPPDAGDHHPMMRIFEFSLDTLKIIIGALLGSLSLAATKQWGNTPADSTTTGA